MVSLRLRGGVRGVGVVVVWVLVVGVLVGGGSGSAVADSFSPPPGPPSVSTVELSSGEVQDVDIEPGHPRSADVYSVTAFVSNPAGLADLSRVQLCVWLPATNLLTGEVNSDNVCNPTVDDGSGNPVADPYTDANPPDPHTVFIAEWAWDKSSDATDSSTWVDEFTVVESSTSPNKYELQDSSVTSGYSDISSDTTMTISFDFKVSHAMRHSNDWNVTVLAEDGLGVGDPDVENRFDAQTKEDVLVKYFGQVQTDSRTELDFGALGLSGQTSRTVAGETLGNYTANAASDVTLEADHFVSASGDTLVLQQDSGSGLDGSGELVFRCSTGDSFDSNSAAVVDSGAEIFHEAVAVSGVAADPERWESIGNHSCELEFLGGAQVPNTQYSNDVTVALVADEANAPRNLVATASSSGDEVVLEWDQPIAANDASVTLANYLIERHSGDGNFQPVTGSGDGDGVPDANGEIVSGFTEQMRIVDTGLTPQNTYTYRVTANYGSGEGAGATVSQGVTTPDPKDTVTLLANINNQFNAANSTFLVTAIRNGLRNSVAGGQEVIAISSPWAGQASAEQLEGTWYTDVRNRGEFSLPAFLSNSDLALASGFPAGGDDLNGHPYLGFVAFRNDGSYIGAAVMAYTDYGSGTALRNLFYPNQFRSLAAVSLNKKSSDVTRDDIVSNGDLRFTTSPFTSTVFSDGQRPGTSGYHSQDRFSADDGIWGYSNGRGLDGNGGVFMNTSGGFGVQSPGSDSSDQYLYWNGNRYTNGFAVFFTVYPSP